MSADGHIFGADNEKRKGKGKKNVNHQGSKLRHARLMRGYTLKQLAARVNCSESMISKLENSRLSPSLGMLHRIADELGTTASDLLVQEDSGTSRDKITLFPPQRLTGPSAEELNSEVKVWFDRILPLDRSGLLQANILHLAPGGEQPRYLAHEGEELLFVLAGTVDIIIEDQIYSVAEGGAIYFPSTLEHRYRNSGTDTARAFWVNTPPTTG